MIAIKIVGNELPYTPPRLEEITIGTYWQSMEHTDGGIVLIRQTMENRQIETFIPYHRVWEIETIRD